MDWKMSGFNGDFELEGSVENHSFNLKLSASKPPVLHDLDGLIEFPIAGNSYYYTYPRLEVSGTLVDHGSLKTVTGTAWMDHQWGNFDPILIDWDWYSVQLNDNTELMFFRVREPGGPIIHSLGTYIDADGESYALSMDDISVDHFDTWTSPSTKVTYHTGWLLNLPRFGISLRLDPTVQESEFYIPNINMPVYWEGPVEVSGTKDGFPIKGHGFVELTVHIESGKKLTSP
jgi:predicted secreted hydrolase